MMDASAEDFLDLLFLARLGYSVSPIQIESPQGEPLSRDEAVGRYRSSKPTEERTDVPSESGWASLQSDPLPSYEVFVERLRSKSRRKETGFHQTPSNLAEFTVSRVQENLQESDKELKEVTALDPACGTGVFLREWLRGLGNSVSSDPGEEVLHYVRQGHLTGVDTDSLALHAADLSVRGVLLDDLGLPPHRIRDLDLLLHQGDWTKNGFGDNEWEAVIGNPPYVRTQNMESDLRDRLSKESDLLTGRFDLSVAFLEKSVRALESSGFLGFVMSNKLLTSNYGKKIRPWLAEEYSLREIHNLSDSRAFGAAVLPMVLVVGGRDVGLPERFVYSEWTGEDFQNDVGVWPHLSERYLQYERLDRKLWSFGDHELAELFDRIEEEAPTTLGEYAEEIRVGVKTTANAVFANPVTESFLEARPGIREFAEPVLRGHNIDRWGTAWTGHDKDDSTYLIYPYRSVNGEREVIEWDHLPSDLREWFLENEDQLKGRTYVMESNREWYEPWVPQQPALFSGRKIVVPDLSDRNRFALDERGFYCLDSAYSVKLRSEASREDYLYLLGWLNSSAIEDYFRTRLKNSLYSNRYRYMKSTLEQIPFIPPMFADKSAKGEIVSIVEDATQDESVEGPEEERAGRLGEMVKAMI